MNRMRTVVRMVMASCLSTAWLSSVAIGDPLAAPVEQALAKSKQLIVASTKKDGSLSEPAEVWFLYDQGKILVSSQANAWRVRRIKAGRPRAKLWVQNIDGPAFMATGKIVDDPKLRQLLTNTYAEKYKSEWPAWKDNYTIGFKNGTRVLIQYTPDPTSSAPQPVHGP